MLSIIVFILFKEVDFFNYFIEEDEVLCYNVLNEDEVVILYIVF